MGEEKSDDDDIEMQIETLFTSFSAFAKYTQSLPAALALTHLLSAIIKRTKSVCTFFFIPASLAQLTRTFSAFVVCVKNQLGWRLSELVEEFLHKTLPTKGDRMKETVAELVSVYVQQAKQPINVMEQLITQHLAPLVGKRYPGHLQSLNSYLNSCFSSYNCSAAEDRESDKFGSLTADTLTAYLRTLLTHLDSCLAATVLANDQEPGVTLATLKQLVLLFQALCHLSRCEVLSLPSSFSAPVAKLYQSKQLPASALTTLLRKGRGFLDQFIKVMPFLSKHFMRYHQEIVTLLKVLQQATRTLQALCAHSKVIYSKKVSQEVNQFTYSSSTIIGGKACSSC